MDRTITGVIINDKYKWQHFFVNRSFCAGDNLYVKVVFQVDKLVNEDINTIKMGLGITDQPINQDRLSYNCPLGYYDKKKGYDSYLTQSYVYLADGRLMVNKKVSNLITPWKEYDRITFEIHGCYFNIYTNGLPQQTLHLLPERRYSIFGSLISEQAITLLKVKILIL